MMMFRADLNLAEWELRPLPLGRIRPGHSMESSCRCRSGRVVVTDGR